MKLPKCLTYKCEDQSSGFSTHMYVVGALTCICNHGAQDMETGGSLRLVLLGGMTFGQQLGIYPHKWHWRCLLAPLPCKWQWEDTICEKNADSASVLVSDFSVSRISCDQFLKIVCVCCELTDIGAQNLTRVPFKLSWPRNHLCNPQQWIFVLYKPPLAFCHSSPKRWSHWVSWLVFNCQPNTPRVIYKEGILIEELPQSHWPVCMSLGHCLVR